MRPRRRVLPTERTLKWLRRQGYVAEVVERHVHTNLGAMVKALTLAQTAAGAGNIEAVQAHLASAKLDEAPFTRDFCGFADIIAFKAGPPITGGDLPIPLGETVAVQCTSAAHLADRLKKVRQEIKATAWLQCGNRILVVAWGFKGQPGKRKTWSPTVEEVTLDSGYTPPTEGPRRG